jgi:hypothetical protein
MTTITHDFSVPARRDISETFTCDYLTELLEAFNEAAEQYAAMGIRPASFMLTVRFEKEAQE